MIEIDRISKVYYEPLLKKSTQALNEVSLSVSEGSTFGIVGPNGAGKSTLLKILLGLVKPTSGDILIDGVSYSDFTCRRSLGFLAENPCLYDHLSLTDHIKFITNISKISQLKSKKTSINILRLLGLEHVKNKPIRTFSKGMVQRAALACALFTNPKVLILDEPMSGLDPLGRKMVNDIIRDYNSHGNTVLFCSHVLTDVERICDRIAIMDKGQLALTITPEELHGVVPDVEGESPLETLFIRTVEAGGK